jgi:hypothetical protein
VGPFHGAIPRYRIRQRAKRAGLAIIGKQGLFGAAAWSVDLSDREHKQESCGKLRETTRGIPAKVFGKPPKSSSRLLKKSLASGFGL